MIAIVAATEQELAQYLKGFKGGNEKRIGSVRIMDYTDSGYPVVVAISGVGIKRAVYAVRTLTQNYNVDVIISAGFCGALTESLKPGDVVIGKWVRDAGSDRKINLIHSFKEIPYGYVKGGILTCRHFINLSEDKISLGIETSAYCVDMETMGIAATAAESGIGVIAMRAVSDGLSSDLPSMGRIYGKGSGLNLSGALNYFLNNPGHIFPFFRFRFIYTRKASASIAQCLDILVPAIAKLLP